MEVNSFIRITVVSILLLFLLVARASAEPYVSKDFPPNEVIVKAVHAIVGGSGANSVILGKTGKDNEFTVFVVIPMPSPMGNMAQRFWLIRLDTNMWILQQFPSGHSMVLTK